MSHPALAVPGAPFGLPWDASCAEVRQRFPGIRPKVETGEAIAFHTDSLLGTVQASGGFCPAVLISGAAREGDEVVFAFSGGALQSVTLCFSYGFSEIGQDPDALSDQAMSAFARAEMHRTVFEFASRYGAPVLLSEVPGRHGRMHVQGTALFAAPDAGNVQLLFGHDGGSFLAGEVRYRKPATCRFGL